VRPADVMAMGSGGLLKETGARVLPRAQAVEPAAEAAPPRTPRIGAVVLAAGRSTRMGGVNKLLAEIDGRPMVRRVVDQVRQSQAAAVVVVTGHQRERVTAALDGTTSDSRCLVVHNLEFAAGLSTSLHRGLTALPEEVDGTVICLADMPEVTAAVIDRLIAAFDPLEGRDICLPTWGGKRGNPVLLARRFFAEVQAISGDVGARALIGEYPDAVVEVAMDDLAQGAAVLADVDTPEDLATLSTKRA
jgi:molybdenum cofactor cytidylyltransferase